MIRIEPGLSERPNWTEELCDGMRSLPDAALEIMALLLSAERLHTVRAYVSIELRRRANEPDVPMTAVRPEF